MATKKKQFGRKIWFKNKRYGWGWAPATWQGWLILALWLTIVIVWVININDNASSLINSLLSSVLPVLIMVIIFVMISYGRGERPKLQWRKRPASRRLRLQTKR